MASLRACPLNLTSPPKDTNWFKHFRHNWSPIIPKLDRDLLLLSEHPNLHNPAIPHPVPQSINLYQNLFPGATKTCPKVTPVAAVTLSGCIFPSHTNKGSRKSEDSHPSDSLLSIPHTDTFIHWFTFCLFTHTIILALLSPSWPSLLMYIHEFSINQNIFWPIDSDTDSLFHAVSSVWIKKRFLDGIVIVLAKWIIVLKFETSCSNLADSVIIYVLYSFCTNNSPVKSSRLVLGDSWCNCSNNIIWRFFSCIFLRIYSIIFLSCNQCKVQMYKMVNHNSETTMDCLVILLGLQESLIFMIFLFLLNF